MACATEDQADAFERALADPPLCAWALGAESDASTADLMEMFCDLSPDEADRTLLKIGDDR